MSGNDKHLDRRSVLKAIGTTAVVGAGLGSVTGSAVAQSEADQLARNYDDETRLRFAFEQHAGGVRQTLVDEGIVAEDFDFGTLEFDLDSGAKGLEPTAEDRLAGVTGLVDGPTSAFGFVSTSSDTHEISLYVQPERDDAYALVEPLGGGERLLVQESSVSPTGCTYTECQNECCTEDYKEKYYYDCDSNCQNCVVYDQDCSCKDTIC
jgi:hypothetical protein